MLLRIKDWAKHYENNRTRELKRMDWVPVPNKHDGDGFATLMDHPNGLAHLGAWLLILQVASKCETRGTLSRADAKPHTAVSIARIGRGDAKIVQEAIDRLVSEVQWLEVVEKKADRTIPQQSAEIPHLPAEDCGKSAASRARQCAPAERNGTEWNGREEAAAAVFEEARAECGDPVDSAPPSSPPPLAENEQSEIAKLLQMAMPLGTAPPDADILRRVRAAMQGALPAELAAALIRFRRRGKPPDSYGFWPIYLADALSPAARVALATIQAPVEVAGEPPPCRRCEGYGVVGVHAATAEQVRSALSEGSQLCQCACGEGWAAFLAMDDDVDGVPVYRREAVAV